MTALEILERSRDHVAKYGPTGGNYFFTKESVCPRGLVSHFAGEKRRNPFQVPLTPEGRVAIRALDEVAAPKLNDESEVLPPIVGNGGFAEAYCHRIDGDRKKGVKYFDEAIAAIA